MPGEITETATVAASPDLFANAIEAAPETIALLQLFERMDATTPVLRLAIASGIIARSLLLLLIGILLLRRRIKRLDNLPDHKFRALRWQAQDVISSTDMKALRLKL